MPELPEVEHFRQLLLPLKSSLEAPSCLKLECPSSTPPKSFPTKLELNSLEQFFVADVCRKGKLVRLEMIRYKGGKGPLQLFLYLRFGMTGRISTADHIPALKSLTNDVEYPPPHTHLVLRSNDYEAAFSDPRRFGAVIIIEDDNFADLAPDAMNGKLAFGGLLGQRKGIKTLLLDQRSVMSGVGNWVADEVLYQSGIHPDQKFLMASEGDSIKMHLSSILHTAVTCLGANENFPVEWIFNYRWRKGSLKTAHVKDSKGRDISFLKSGGRTSAVVPSLQKLKSRKSNAVDGGPSFLSSNLVVKAVKNQPTKRKRSDASKQGKKSGRNKST